MSGTTSVANLKLAWSPSLRACDLVIDPVGNGRGRIAIDRTLATTVMIALGTDRRADATDTLPSQKTDVPNQGQGLRARRGWVGDVLLPTGTRWGSKLWLLATGKQTDADRVAAADYAAQALQSTTDYLGVSASTSAVIVPGVNGGAKVTAVIGALSITTPVTPL